ncbi:unnamed protein product, partial [Prorocentrum cordatum]
MPGARASWAGVPLPAPAGRGGPPPAAQAARTAAPTLLTQQRRAQDGRGEAGGLHAKTAWDSRPPRGAAEPAADGGKGAISLLQEFVQCTKTCSGPQDRPVLQWSFQQRASAGPLEFCATVALVLDGVPHHVMGAWHASKKAAQRDAADRALAYFVGAWGQALQRQALGPEADKARPPASPAGERRDRAPLRAAAGGERRALEEHCAYEGGPCGG